MNHIGKESLPSAMCSKHVWVMSVLADDEALGDHGRLPQGLRFHLSQCPPCRALADRLAAVTDGLGLLADLEPSETLTNDADRQARNALSVGARLTGRVDVVDPASPALGGARRAGWPRVARYAAAAVIGLSFGAAGLWSQRHPPAQTVANGAPSDHSIRRSNIAAPRLAHPEDVLLPALSPTARRAEMPTRDEMVPVLAKPTSEPGSDGRDAVVGVTPFDVWNISGSSTDPALLLPPPARTISTSPDRPLCRHLTYLEAAECEYGHTLDKPLFLPRIEGRRRPKRPSPPHRVDIPTKTRSTAPRPAQRQRDRPSG